MLLVVSCYWDLGFGIWDLFGSIGNYWDLGFTPLGVRGWKD